MRNVIQARRMNPAIRWLEHHTGSSVWVDIKVERGDLQSDVLNAWGVLPSRAGEGVCVAIGPENDARGLILDLDDLADDTPTRLPDDEDAIEIELAPGIWLVIARRWTGSESS